MGAGLASAQELRFNRATFGNDTAQAMSALAVQAIAFYKDDNRDRYLDNLFRLQIVAGRYADATNTLSSLRTLRKNRVSLSATAVNSLYAILAAARQRSAGAQFEETFRQQFSDAFARLDDKTSALAIRALSVNRSAQDRAVDRVLQQQKGRETIPLADALRLIRAYQVQQAFRAIVPLAGPLVDADDRRRYIIDRNIPVRTPDGATVCSMVVRPRSVTRRLPALLNFTIYADSQVNLIEARRAASNGYVGVIGLTRGKMCSPDKPVPYEHDGSDAAALIDWIAAQSWSDGRVGMYGGSYNGFTQWAAAKHMPTALKTIIPAVAVGPGIDVPMDGNLFLSFIYPWPFYTTNVKALDDTTYNNFARWNRLNRDWYVSGRAYRDLDRIDGTPNPVFDTWIAHPTYDSYWQSMIPYENDFARINIPVLETAGYYYGGPGAAVYYLTQHYKYNPRAEHYLVIGPYDHLLGQRGLVTALGDTIYEVGGYRVDPVALTDLGELRYQWFDYIFKGAPKPALLKDKINYQVMGANEWKHAPSIAAMSNQALRYYLIALRDGNNYRASERNPATNTTVAQAMDLADRTDADRTSPGGGIVDSAIDTWNGITFVSNPLLSPIETSGLFSGRLEFVTNKKDFDINISLYELTPKNEYVLLSTYWTRASAVGDLEHRRLLTPGQRERLDFQSVRLTSRQMQAGSRIVVLINLIKQPDLQINYGTGKDVSDETIADANEPLTIRWFGDSYIEIPIHL
ncbi:MAG TPA: CocE/NonD family hydrolase [Gemmatimonadaceae bacterium]|nr:CocE/NonD family hydrolase [Gemmatimonadaceae bacterium]